MGGRGRIIQTAHRSFSASADNEPLPKDMDAYLGINTWSDTVLHMMGRKYSRVSEDRIGSSGFSSMKEALYKEHRRRYGTEPSWSEE